MQGPRRLAARHRVARDEAAEIGKPRPHLRDDRGLGRTDVGQHAVGAYERNERADDVGDRLDRGADEDEVGAAGEVFEPFAGLDARRDRGELADVLGIGVEHTRAQRGMVRADRAQQRRADQAGAYDGDDHAGLRRRGWGRRAGTAPIRRPGRRR